MLKRLTQQRLSYISMMAFMFIFSSCVTHEELLNFQEGPAFPDVPEDILQNAELKVQPDDILNINVHSVDREAAAPYNLSTPGSITSESAELSTLGFLVDSEGNIDYPGLGTLSVNGLTIQEVKKLILERVEEYLNNPIVTVRFVNFKVTVLGEVNIPSTLNIADEKITVLEAIGLAGDITAYGNRSDILIIREQNGQREYGHIDLRSREVFNSPYFYLKQNDVIYISPTKQKTASIRNQAQNIVPWVTAFTSFAALVITIVR